MEYRFKGPGELSQGEFFFILKKLYKNPVSNTIEVDFVDKTLIIPKDFKININKYKILHVPLYINTEHWGILIINKENKTVEKYDSYGVEKTNTDKILKKYFLEEFKYKYINIDSFLKKRKPIQVIEESTRYTSETTPRNKEYYESSYKISLQDYLYRPSEGSALNCGFWALMFVDYKFKYPNKQSKDIIDMIYSDMNKVSIHKLIQNYKKKILNIISKNKFTEYNYTSIKKIHKLTFKKYAK